MWRTKIYLWLQRLWWMVSIWLYSVDILNFRTGIRFFDETKCQWILYDQKPCPVDVITTASTIKVTSTTLTSQTISTNITTTSPKSLETINYDDDSQVIMTTVQVTCKQLDESWTCSNDYNNFSFCVKFCSNKDSKEHQKCMCEDNSCNWILMGEPCAIEAMNDSNEVSLKTGSVVGQWLLSLFKCQFFASVWGCLLQFIKINQFRKRFHIHDTWIASDKYWSYE